jgi:hypothetical protein
MMFKVGDVVEWESQSHGFKKRKEGTVVAVVLPSCSADGSIPPGHGYKLYIPGGTRDMESYLVKVGKRRTLYWPRSSALHLAGSLGSCRVIGSFPIDGSCTIAPSPKEWIEKLESRIKDLEVRVTNLEKNPWGREVS